MAQFCVQFRAQSLYVYRIDPQNKRTFDKFGDISRTQRYSRILSILDSKDKIPSVGRIGAAGRELYYNFWQDENHVQGIWRRTTLESFRRKETEWETVLDLDALPAPEVDTAETWVWHGHSLLDEGPDGAWDRTLGRN